MESRMVELMEAIQESEGQENAGCLLCWEADNF